MSGLAPLALSYKPGKSGCLYASQFVKTIGTLKVARTTCLMFSGPTLSTVRHYGRMTLVICLKHLLVLLVLLFPQLNFEWPSTGWQSLE
jgi:hypothetical protein